MQHRALFFLIICQVLGFALPTHAAPSAGVKVVFLSPDTSRFWHMVGGFMQAVADDLEIDLTIYTDQDRNRFSYRDLLNKVLEQPDRPDYIVFMCKEKVTHDMLTRVGEAGIKVFTFNTSVPEEELAKTGQPREKLPHWIGHLSPDNRAAGATLATELFKRYQQKTGNQANMLVGLSGSRDSSAAIHRNEGLRNMLEGQGSIDHQLLFADWDQEEARLKVERLIARYPALDLIWNASDGMALGAIDAARATGRKPGEDLMVGGLDWEQRALDEIGEGRMALSLGRHFMGGGLALLLIHDYHTGYDFAGQGGVSMNYSLAIADRDNLGGVREVMDPANWDETDFRQFSKHYTEALRGDTATASELLDDFMGALSPGFQR